MNHRLLACLSGLLLFLGGVGVGASAGVLGVEFPSAATLIRVSMLPLGLLVAASLPLPTFLAGGAVLLLEEVDERPYRIDRMLAQLEAAGKLTRVAGIGVGDVSTCRDERFPQPSALEVIESFARRAGVPLVADLPIGHVRRNATFGLGVRATIDGHRGEIRLLEQGVLRAT